MLCFAVCFPKWYDCLPETRVYCSFCVTLCNNRQLLHSMSFLEHLMSFMLLRSSASELCLGDSVSVTWHLTHSTAMCLLHPHVLYSYSVVPAAGPVMSVCCVGLYLVTKEINGPTAVAGRDNSLGWHVLAGSRVYKTGAGTIHFRRKQERAQGCASGCRKLTHLPTSSGNAILSKRPSC